MLHCREEAGHAEFHASYTASHRASQTHKSQASQAVYQVPLMLLRETLGKCPSHAVSVSFTSREARLATCRVFANRRQQRQQLQLCRPHLELLESLAATGPFFVVEAEATASKNRLKLQEPPPPQAVCKNSSKLDLLQISRIEPRMKSGMSGVRLPAGRDPFVNPATLLQHLTPRNSKSEDA